MAHDLVCGSPFEVLIISGKDHKFMEWAGGMGKKAVHYFFFKFILNQVEIKCLICKYRRVKMFVFIRLVVIKYLASRKFICFGKHVFFFLFVYLA